MTAAGPVGAAAGAAIIAGMSAPPSSRFVQAWRMLRIALHLAAGGATMACVFPFASPARRRGLIRSWSRDLLQVLVVHLHVHGQPPRRSVAPMLLLANHVSWLDIFVVNAILPVRFVAKSEVRRWPLIGWMSERAGTVFIRRARRSDTARVNEVMSQAMRHGDPFAVFPEATTTDGTRVLKFHSSLLHPASLADAALQPVAIRYRRADGAACTEAAYDGDKSVWDTLRLLVTQPAVHAHVSFLPRIAVAGKHRRELAHAARESILRDLLPETRRSRTAPGCGHRAAAQ